MKICIAQTKPVKGNIEHNIINHKNLISLALVHGSDAIIFPELSLTGYEPTLAKELATNQNDTRLDDFQHLSDTKQITIGVGLPTKQQAGVCISMILFQPGQPRQTYSKKYLHADEEPFFVCGQNITSIQINKNRVAPAICYELSIPAHAANASASGATMYVASVAKTSHGIDNASKTLADIAAKYSMTVLLSNCVGYCDNFDSDGRSAIWNNNGLLLAQLNNSTEGILILDTETKDVIKINF